MKDKQLTFPEGFTPFEELSGMPPETPFLVALSGGADSRMLFELAARHCRRHSSHFFACHVNHGIRGDEAVRDRDFCVSLAKECAECADIFVLNADVPSLAKELGLGIEQCARRVRYDFFDKVMLENRIPLLVTAHNADDNLETLVFNLTRGAGIKGMRGIPETRSVQNGLLIRPMLGIPKSEVLEFCHREELDYVTDSTNSQTEYTRNLIRADIIPVLERINPSVRRSAAKMCRAMSDVWSMTVDAARAYLSEDGTIDVSALKEADQRLLPYVFSIAAETVGADLEAVHLDALRDLCLSGRDGSSVSLPGNLRAVIVGNVMTFEPDRDAPDDPHFDIPLTYGETLIPGWRINCEKDVRGLYLSLERSPLKENTEKNINVYKLDIKAHIIFDTIKRSDDDLRLRTRVEGDRILSRGMHKSVKKLMCDKKLPRTLRDSLPMLVCKNDLLWIPTVAVADGITVKED